MPLDSSFTSSNPTESDGFLRAIKIRITISFEGEVKPSAPSRKILRHVKESYEYERRTSLAKFTAIFSPSFSYFATGFFCWLLPQSYGK
jgi:hypothetical protein